MNMHRKIIAVILGMIVCQTVFSFFALATMQLWPDYATHAHLYLDQRIFTFTSIMACMNLVFWVLGFIGAGWTTAHIARDSRALCALTGLMQIYAIYVHILRSWSTFPWWYNLVIVFSVVPATLWGGRPVRAREDTQARRCGLAT
jgi:hypothetical protein